MSPHGPERDSAGTSTRANVRRPLVVLAARDEETRQAMRTILETWNLDVAEAASCSKASEVAGDVHPDLVLLDAEIPFTESLEAAAALRNQKPTADIPVLMISEFTQPPFREAARAPGYRRLHHKTLQPRAAPRYRLEPYPTSYGPEATAPQLYNRPRIRPNSVV